MTRWLERRILEIKVALMFLTTIPVIVELPAHTAARQQDLEGAWRRLNSDALRWYPLAGALIGVVVVLAALGTFFLLRSAFIAAVIGLAVEFALTGGLHLDGISDTADGIMSGTGRERILEIMDDPRTGAMGVITLVVVSLLKVGLVAHILEISGPVTSGFLIVLAFLSSRYFGTAAMVYYPWAKPEGIARAFNKDRLAAAVQGAGVIAMLLLLLLSLALIAALLFSMGGAVDWPGLPPAPPAALIGVALFAGLPLVAAALAARLAGGYLAARLQGLTGDCYGAIIEVTAVITLFVGAAVLVVGRLKGVL